MLVSLKLGFFSKGLTTAILKASGKTPVLREVFMMSSTWLETLLNTRLRNAVGTGSMSEVEELHSETVLQSSSNVMHVNLPMLFTLLGLPEYDSFPSRVMLVLMVVILLLKNCASSSHFIFEDCVSVGAVLSS